MSNIKRPSFTDRDVQYPNRVTLLPSEGSAVTYDVVPAPGTVTQEGTPVDSDLMNEMADYSELGYKNKLYVSANGHADDVFYETGEPSTVNIYGQTRQNLWKNPSGTRNGVTVTSNEDGSISLSGTATHKVMNFHSNYTYVLKPGESYYIACDPAPVGFSVGVTQYKKGPLFLTTSAMPTGGGVITMKSDAVSFTCVLYGFSTGSAVSGTYRIMLREATDAEILKAQQTASTLQEGGTADIPQDHPVTLPAYPIADSKPFDWCPPGLTSVSELVMNVSGKNMANDIFSVNNSTPYASVIGIKTPLIPGETYTISFDTEEGWKGYINENITTKHTIIGNGNNVATFTLLDAIPKSEYNTDGYLYLVKNDGTNNVPPNFSNVQIELGTEATAYELPVGSSTPIDLKGNVLSSLPDGTRDALTVDANGKRSIVKRVATVNTSNAIVTDIAVTPGVGAVFVIQTDIKGTVPTDINLWPDFVLCDKCIPSPRNYTNNLTLPACVNINGEGKVVFGIRDASIVDEETAQAYIRTLNATVVYAMAVPQTVELGNINPVIPPSTTTNMWVTANSVLAPELDFTYDKRLSLGSNTTFGFVKGDGTTIDVINGVVQLAGDVISGIWDKVKPYADATYALINHTHTASQLPKATTSALGLVKPDGSTLSIDGNGTLSVAGGGSGYTLPPATATTLGGIKVGDNLTVESDGTLNATGGGGSIPNPLPIAQGGTGAQTAAAAEYNILGSPNASSNAIGDSDKLAVVYASPSASNGVLYTQTASKLWTYIKSKADSVYRAAAAKIPWADLEDVPASFPPSAHTHSAGNITAGTLPIARGGTGGATADAALTNLGVKGTTSGNVTEHYKLGKLHFIRITGTVASLANNQTTVGPFNLGFNMPAQPSGASAVSFTQGTLLSRYTSNAKATVNTLSYTSRSSISINLFAQQAISTSVTYDVWLAVSEA